MRAVKRKYALEEAKKSDCPTEIEVFGYDTKQDFEGTSVGVLESRERHSHTRQTVSCQVYLILEGEGEFLFGNGEGDEVMPIAKDDLVLI
jgi:mannose-6-phosphate isomerase-like protein (cupin superfamily)